MPVRIHLHDVLLYECVVFRVSVSSLQLAVYTWLQGPASFTGSTYRFTQLYINTQASMLTLLRIRCLSVGAGDSLNISVQYHYEAENSLCTFLMSNGFLPEQEQNISQRKTKAFTVTFNPFYMRFPTAK